MDETTEPSTPIKGRIEEEKEEDFYENIEAPKFVDLSAPDRYLPTDDRYWFCLRVGCDQKHEEEMDSEAIYKNFVLRVMAARSPNIRLRKALCKKDPSTNLRCPLTVPAKSSRSRVSRLALISSISKKLTEPKVKAKALPKHSATPIPKAKQSSIVAKALTTPCNKKKRDPDTFQSVRNSKPTASVVPKKRVVSKALVFHSPKKIVNIKASSELKKLCSGMKKLDITRGKNNERGYNRTLPSDSLRKQMRGREVKSRVYNSCKSQNRKGQEAKSESRLKRNNKDKDGKCCQVENEYGDVEADKKSVRSTSISSNDDEGNENKLSEATRSDKISLLTSEERNLLDSNVSEGEVANVESNMTNKEIDNEECRSIPDERSVPQTIEIVEKGGNVITSHDKQNAFKVTESDDKENAVASDSNRDPNHHDRQSQKKLFGKHATCKNISKATGGMAKPSKESYGTAANTQAVKYRKPKPTNPKPFRLRTDERGILKEANLEKRLQYAPQEESTTSSKFAEGTSVRKQQKANQKMDKFLGQSAYGNETQDCSGKEFNRIQQKDLSPNIVASYKLASTQRYSGFTRLQTNLVGSKSGNIPDKAAKKLNDQLKRSKLKLMRPPRAAPSKQEKGSLVKPGKLCVIEETFSRTRRSVEAENAGDSGVYEATTVSAIAISRTLLVGKRPTTIPKEPNFHSIHTPKSCPRRVA